MLVIAGCSGQSGTTTDTVDPATTEETVTQASEMDRSDGNIQCTDGDIPRGTDLDRLFPEPPNGMSLSDSDFSRDVLEGYEEQVISVYEDSENTPYQMSITRWGSSEAAQNAANSTILPTARSGHVVILLLYDAEEGDSDTAEELITSVPCVSQNDIVEIDVEIETPNVTVSFEPTTPTPERTIEIGEIDIETEEQRFDDEYPVKQISIQLINTGDVTLSDYSVEFEINGSGVTFAGSEEVEAGEEVVVTNNSSVSLLTLNSGDNRVTVSVSRLGTQIANTSTTYEK
jgi:hypothetical protein